MRKLIKYSSENATVRESMFNQSSAIDFVHDHLATGAGADRHGYLPAIFTEALRRLVVDLSQRLEALEDQLAELGDQLGTSEAARAWSLIEAGTQSAGAATGSRR